MALPAIMPYPMPKEADLPANRAPWKLAPSRCALLIHDMQQYFVDAFTPEQSPIVELLANIDQLRTACREQGIPVIYSAQPGDQRPEDRGLQTYIWGPGMKEGPQQRIVEAIAPSVGDTVMTKWRYNAFRKTNLLEMLQEQGRDQLIICGIYAHIGVLMTTCDAFMQEIEPFLVADAVADFTLEEHMMAVNYAARRCAVTTTTAGLLESLGSLPVQAEPAADASSVGVDLKLFSLEAMRKQVAELLDESPVNLQDTDDLINEWGMDSVRVMRLVEQWRRNGADVSFVELAERPTLAHWRSLLISKLVPTLPNTDYCLVEGK
ncbi:bifunctional isochorismate lyase/aryl carrier protein [Paenibacillus cellulosilyticus]|uniref:isochorismatase n=1 Tax=Paenibacillus cellulosilyticus TaxID=375489 RepID=A0A2V2YUS4_9BACL|nr:isochorismatase family protein [Paenibacillus cellulosilyticus]PWV93784.1 bifunctional isochorismate lyase/aryl carrier protein [Paenibacillus cellulosilyticus]QKS47402.1 isochorismatase family protein [Paenibacillus cellulosilyticus]